MKKKIATLLLTLAALAGIPTQAAAWNNGPIWDAKVIFSDDPNVGCGAGFTRLDPDLNRGAEGKFVYLCVSYMKGDHVMPIAGLMVCNMVCPPGYEVMRAEPFDLPGYLNAGVEGGYLLVFGYYRGNTNPVRRVGFLATVPAPFQELKDSFTTCNYLPREDYDYWEPMPGVQDLNRGGGGHFIYPCLNYMPGGSRDSANLVWDFTTTLYQGCPLNYFQTGPDLNAGTTGAGYVSACIRKKPAKPEWDEEAPWLYGGALATIGTVAKNQAAITPMEAPCAEIGGRLLEVSVAGQITADVRIVKFCVSRAHTPADPDRSIDDVQIVSLTSRPNRPQDVCPQQLGPEWEPVRAINEEGVNDLNAGAGGDFLYACVHKSRQHLEYAFDGPIFTPEPGSVFSVDATMRGTDGLVRAAFPYPITVSDGLDGSMPLVCDPPSGTTFVRRTFSGVLLPAGFSCSATDSHLNVSTADYYVAIVDAPPVLTFPMDVTLEADSTGGRIVTFAVSAVDRVDGVVPVTCSHASGSSFAVGVTTVTCRAADQSFFTSNAAFTVTILPAAPPALHLPGSFTVDAASHQGTEERVTSVTWTASASDAGAVPVTCAPTAASAAQVVQYSAGAASLRIGTSVFTCSASDALGNTATGSFSIIVKDRKPPVITAPASLQVEAADANGATVTTETFGLTAVDHESSVVSITRTPSASQFAIGSTTVTWTVKDEGGNIAIATQTVVVADTQAPTSQPLPALYLEAAGPLGATAPTIASPQADDAVGVTTMMRVPAGYDFPLGETTITWTISDAAGNHATATQRVVVRDTTAPVVAGGADIILEATGPEGASLSAPLAAPLATDAVGVVSISRSHAGAQFAPGETIITWSAIDAAGNVGTSHQRVLVQDSVAPVFTIDPIITVTATGPVGATLTTQQIRLRSVSDNVQVAYSSRTPSGYSFPIGTTIVTWTVGDWAGNEASATQQVVVLPMPSPEPEPEPEPEPTPEPIPAPSIDQQIDELDQLITIRRLDAGLNKLARALKREKTARACTIAANLTDAIQRINARKLADGDRAELMRRMAMLVATLGCGR
jgi:hypothetical protein